VINLLSLSLSSPPPRPSSPFIGEVGEEVFFMPLDRVCIYKNITGGYI
jgi:hypothetical protein